MTWTAQFVMLGKWRGWGILALHQVPLLLPLSQSYLEHVKLHYIYEMILTWSRGGNVEMCIVYWKGLMYGREKVFYL